MQVRALRERFDYPGPLLAIGLLSFLNVLAHSFLWPLMTLYMTTVHGRTMTTAGLVLFIGSAAASGGALLGGLLFDRWGARPVVLGGMGLSALFAVVPGLVTSFPLFVGSYTLFMAASAAVFPALNALAGRVWPEGGRRAFNLVYVAHNLGVALGTVIGGQVAKLSFSFSFLSAAVGFLIATVAAAKLISPQLGARGRSQREKGEGRIPWLPIGALFLALVVCWITYVQWQGTISVWMKGQGMGLDNYTFLWTINGLVIFLAQPALSWVTTRLRSLAGQLYLGLALYGAAFLLLQGHPSYGLLVGGMVVLTLGEVLLWPGFPAAADSIAPNGRKGTVQGFIASAGTAGRMVGPLLGGMVFDHFGFSAVMQGAAGALVLPALLVGLYTVTRRKRVA
jgi:MFS family permease